jgi:hypothetical protein
MFQKQALFLFSIKEAPNLFLITAHLRNSTSLRHIPENRSSPRVEQENATEKLKLTTRPKIKSWANQQLKNHRNSHKLKIDQTTDTTEKSRTHVFKSLTPLTPTVEKTVNIHGFE